MLGFKVPFHIEEEAMTSYDPEVLQKFADSLYRRAARIVFLYGFVGLVVGLVTGGIIAGTAKDNVGLSSPGFIWGVVILGTVLGVFLGREKGFSLKLEAQRTLCQMRIERNTAAYTETQTVIKG